MTSPGLDFMDVFPPPPSFRGQMLSLRSLSLSFSRIDGSRSDELMTITHILNPPDFTIAVHSRTKEMHTVDVVISAKGASSRALRERLGFQPSTA